MSALEQVAAPKENPVRKILRRLWLVALVALCMTGQQPLHMQLKILIIIRIMMPRPTDVWT